MEKKSRGSDSQHQPHGFLIFGLVAQRKSSRLKPYVSIARNYPGPLKVNSVG